MGRGMVEGLEEWGGILRTHKALHREVFFSNEFSQCTRYRVFFFNWKLTNCKADRCIAIEPNFIIGPTNALLLNNTLLPSQNVNSPIAVRTAPRQTRDVSFKNGLRIESIGKYFASGNEVIWDEQGVWPTRQEWFQMGVLQGSKL